MASATNRPGRNGGGQVLHLPVRSRGLTTEEAAVYLGMTPRRLKSLALLGGGPSRREEGNRGEAAGGGLWRREDLEEYLALIHGRADISGPEMARRRAERSGQRNAALESLGKGEKTPLPATDPLVMMVSGGELRQQSVFFALKVMTIFGIMMLFLSATPLFRIHFN